MAYEDIIVERVEEWVEISINRPEKRNAMRMQTAADLMAALQEAEEDPKIKVVILKSTERGFCAGIDTSDFKMGPEGPYHSARTHKYQMKAGQLLRLLQDYTKPVISAIEGYALGGGLETALMGDILIADEEAQLGLPEARLGLIPGGGGTQTLTRLIGKAMTKELIWTARRVSGTEAKELGMVNHVTPKGGSLAKAREIAGEIAKVAPLAVMYSKAAINRGNDLPLAQGLATERDMSFVLNFSADREEGLAAFREKRPAEFKGK